MEQSYNIEKQKLGTNWKTNIMYNLPHLYGVQECLHETDLKEILEICGLVESVPVSDYLTEFQEFEKKKID